jgi:hypothetical protein
MIAEGTHPPVQIDLGNDEPGMTLQRWDGEWVNYKVDGKPVKSPVDIDALESGRYFNSGYCNTSETYMLTNILYVFK